jgi:NAD(P)-dependent dehydrogenase (short-subunit alcohol dehydrogenase family)/acyl-CoA thioesterase FadM
MTINPLIDLQAPAGAGTLLLAEPGDADVAAALCDALGAPAATAGFGGAAKYAGPLSWVVAVLPRSAAPRGDERRRLLRMVGRLKSAADCAQAGDGPAGRGVAFVTFGGGRFGTGPGHPDPEQCCAAGFARSLHLEDPGLRVRVIDLADTLPPAEVARAVLGELRGPTPFAAVGYDAGGTRLVPRARLRQPAGYAKRPLGWSAGDVILVTGGGKGITAECSLALARATGARLALVGSSPAPGAGGKADGELGRTLGRFAAEKLACRYYSCDVTDPQAVSDLVRRVRGELGPITGVVHGAGVNRPRRVEQVSAEEAAAEIAPKLLGAHNLCAALADAPPRLFLGLTSIIGVTGMPGNAWYAFSNEALDLVLRRFGAEHPETAVLSVAFSVWGETGMGARMGSVTHLAKKGIGAIPTEEGVRHFLRLFDHDPGDRQVVVTARLGGLDTWPVEPPPAPAGLRFLEHVVRSYPGVELVARTRLTLERDRYLEDHNYRGSFLFPTVFGLEAMTQAATHLTGADASSVVRFEDVRLERPIVVDPQAGVEIEVRAEALEVTREGEQLVRVGIRTEQTGFAADHFAATVVLGVPAEVPAAAVPSGRPLAIDPKTDLYGGLLFQGPRFQRMSPVHELDGDHTIFESESRESASVEGEAFATGRGGPLLLGDPFFRDVLLQAGQMTIPQEVCLPVGIERIERFGTPAPAGRRFVFAPRKVRQGREYVAEIFATDEQGRVLERLTGYRLRILEEHPENPTALDLAHPEARDQRLLREAVAGAVGPDAEAPALALAHLPGLHDLPREERRRRERPVIERALRARLGVEEGASVPFEVGWLPSGKPHFTAAPADGLDLSLSHDDHSCLCAVGTGPVGCDLAPVSTRGRVDWRALLGDSRGALLEQLLREGDTLDRAGARIWSGVEAVRKATGAEDVELACDSREGDAVFLRAPNLPGAPRVLTLPIKLTLGPERMVALVLPAGRRAAPAAVAGLPADCHRVSVAHDGPQGQPVQELRFVVSFQEASGISRRVPASRYLAWMGKMRELVTSSSVPQLIEQIATGEWGLVTNWGEVRVLGELTANDVVQMRFWTDRARGSEVEFFCEFQKVLPGGRLERVAMGEQKATWVRLVGHGQVVPAPLPPCLAEFIERMGPRAPESRPLPALPEPLAGLETGPVTYTAPRGPSPGRVLRAETVQTTLEEANLVGNVYFANYFAWQGRARDLFLHSIAPDYLRGIGARGELVCLRSRVDYLREAMPFDRIQVVLSLVSLSECGAVLGFEYFRVAPGGGREKLSVGTQEVAWVRRRADGTPVPAPFPEVIRRALLEAPASRAGESPAAA